MAVIGYYYLDGKNREILHVPRAFVVVEPQMDLTEVILEPKRLKSRLYGLNKVIKNGLREIQEVEFQEKDIQRVIDLCFSYRKKQAIKKCERIFDKISELLNKADLSDFENDFDGYDPRFKDSLF